MFVRDLLDLLLPQRCAGCRTARGLLCPSCAALLELPARPVPSAGLPTLNPPVWTVTSYEGPIRALIAAHKESGRTGLARPLGRALATAIKSVLALTADPPPGNDLPWRDERSPTRLAAWTLERPSAPPCAPTTSPPADHLQHGTDGSGEEAVFWWQRDEPVIVVPVPSAVRSVRKRGHDPTRRMAAVAVRELRAEGFLVLGAPLLRHRRAVADQAGLGQADRKTNMTGAMALSRREIRVLYAKHGDLAPQRSTGSAEDIRPNPPNLEGALPNPGRGFRTRPTTNPATATLTTETEPNVGAETVQRSSPRSNGNVGSGSSASRSSIDDTAFPMRFARDTSGGHGVPRAEAGSTGAEEWLEHPRHRARRGEPDGDTRPSPWDVDSLGAVTAGPGSQDGSGAACHSQPAGDGEHAAAPDLEVRRGKGASAARRVAPAPASHSSRDPAGSGSTDMAQGSAKRPPGPAIRRSPADETERLPDWASGRVGGGVGGRVRGGSGEFVSGRVVGGLEDGTGASVDGPLVGWRVVVVDDVVTSGATVAEAVRVLRQAGADVVGAATVAATPRRFLGGG